MLIAVAAAAFALGAGVAGFQLHRLVKRIGPSFEEWRSVEPMGGDGSIFIALGTFVLLMLALVGSFLPDWMRAAILGLIVGFCAPFMVEGLRRKAEADS